VSFELAPLGRIRLLCCALLVCVTALLTVLGWLIVLEFASWSVQPLGTRIAGLLFIPFSVLVPLLRVWRARRREVAWPLAGRAGLVWALWFSLGFLTLAAALLSGGG
jgi:hypothetical protein